MSQKYSITISKTNSNHILEDHHFIPELAGEWNTIETQKAVVDLLNDKERQIHELSEENKFLKWYVEELEVHVPKELLNQIKELYKVIK